MTTGQATWESESSPSTREPGDTFVESQLVLVVTRFALRNPLFLLLTYIDYWRLKRQLESQPGLLRSTFLIESATSCFSLSLWRSEDDIPWFGTSRPFHVEIARRVFRRVVFVRGVGPEIWSTKWRVHAVSNNVRWSDFDMWPHLRRTTPEGGHG